MATTVVTPVETETTQPASNLTIDQTRTEQTTQQKTREDVEKKYAQLYGETQNDVTVQGAEAVTTGTGTEAPVVKPEVLSTSTEAPAPVKTTEQMVSEALAAQKAAFDAQMTEVLSRLPKPPEPVKPVEKPLEQYLKEGDLAGYHAEMQRRTKEAIMAELAPQLSQSTTQEAVERIQAQNELTNFFDKVKTDNPDLTPMEDWIAAESQKRIAVALHAKAAKNEKVTPADLVKVTKEAVTESVGHVRKAYLSIRGSGKEEGLTIKKTVVATSPLTPNAVTERLVEKPKDDGEYKGETTLDYISRRQQAGVSGRGFNPPTR